MPSKKFKIDVIEVKMSRYVDLSPVARKELYQELKNEFDSYCSKGLSLDLSRGKPNASQLDISRGLLSVSLAREECVSQSGLDYRNYGILDGIPEMKAFFADALNISREDILIGGNSSLQLMYDALSRAMLFGVYGSERPWIKEDKIKWICVTPGYDRHFKITETLGFELLSVPMTATGPDMDMVEELVKDPAVKGMWCVPKYSNPTGNTYSDDTVKRLASMKCGASDFRIMWDNAYAVHDFDSDGDKLLDIFTEAEKCGNKDRIFYFSSTSKITFPGAGIAMMAASENNRKQIIPLLGVSTIGYDKINQLRHLKFFGNAENMLKHMLSLGHVIGEKFDITLCGLSALDGLGIAEWTKPRGGYFISLDIVEGSARRVYALMKEAGVTLTNVGATFPYGVDPEDKNLRLAPTYPTDDELTLAVKILVVAVKMAALEHLGV